MSYANGSLRFVNKPSVGAVRKITAKKKSTKIQMRFKRNFNNFLDKDDAEIEITLNSCAKITIYFKSL